MTHCLPPVKASLKVSKIEAIVVERSGGRGRPKKVILEAFLREAFRPGQNISIQKVAYSLGVHQNTVKGYMRKYETERQPFSTILNLSLNELFGDYKEAHPNAGIHYIRGYLTQQGMRIQREQIVNSFSRVNSVAKVILQRKTIERHEYKSSRPNALWHVDGHHKLGPWGIVTHGFVDGYDRMVRWHYALTITVTLIPSPRQITGMRVSTRNLAQTVPKLFLDVIEVFGCPYHVRGDRGSENVDLCTWMIMHHGPNRASFMCVRDDLST